MLLAIFETFDLQSIFDLQYFTDYSFATKDVKNLRILHCIMGSTDGCQIAKALTYCDSV